MIEIDCQVIFLLITQNNNGLNPLATMLLNFRQLLQFFEAYDLKKISREQNSCADTMAKDSRTNMLPLRTYSSPPHFAYKSICNRRKWMLAFLAVYFLRFSFAMFCCKWVSLPSVWLFCFNIIHFLQKRKLQILELWVASEEVNLTINYMVKIY